MERYEDRQITKEMLEEMKAHAQIMQDELNSYAESEFERTGRLASAKLCEKSNEYENYALSIELLEKRLDECK